MVSSSKSPQPEFNSLSHLPPYFDALLEGFSKDVTQLNPYCPLDSPHVGSVDDPLELGENNHTKQDQKNWYVLLLFLASDRSSGLHPVSSHNCCMYILACRPAFGRPYVGVHRST